VSYHHGEPAVIVPTHWDDMETPLEDPAEDTGTLAPPSSTTPAHRLSPRSKILVPEHLATLEP
jgi:hypothetical protein